MKAFFYDLQNKIQEAIKKDIKKIFAEIGEEEPYAVALVTDEDFVTLYMAVNTYEYMKNKDEQYIKLFGDKLPKEKVESIRAGKSSFIKWIPAEWGYSDGKESELNKISKILLEKEKSAPIEYSENKAIFLDIVTAAFKNLIQKKFFGEHQEKLTFFISMSDCDGIYEIENYSAKLLNTTEIYKEFLNRNE